MLGIIGGSAFTEGAAPEGTTIRTVATGHGEITLHEGDGFVFIRRHGETYRPPHRVAHAAHARALADAGADAVVGLCSVGGLRAELGPGTVVVPEDYLSLVAPPTLQEGAEPLHIVPALDPDLRALLVAAAGDTRGPVVDGGVYAETRGPRFETRAEVRLLADYADVVGMTAAAEATILQEAGRRYAVLGIVDNYAHGIGTKPLTEARFRSQLEANAGRVQGILNAIIERVRERT